MKYEKIDVGERLYGSGFIIHGWQESDSQVDIYLKSVVKECICPVCGYKNTSLHNTYVRHIQDVPVHGKHTMIHVNAYKYDCENPECGRKVIMQDLPFASSSQRRTDSLNSLILAVSAFLSNEGASRVLRQTGIHVSNDSIFRLYERIRIIDDPDVEAVGIDDVAIRKGQKYATVIYDMKDHHMIALLEGRSKDTLVPWLREHKKIRVVARDRASAYAAAINEVLPECTQVADRFHLLQNLLDRIKDIFKEEIPQEIYIQDGKIVEKPRKIAVSLIDKDDPRLKEYDYDNTDPSDKDGNIIEFDSTNTDKFDSLHKKQAESRKKNSR